MKKQEVESLLVGLDSIKKITDKEAYLVSSAVNQQMNSMKPILEKELNRMNNENIEITSPKIKIIKYTKVDVLAVSFTEIINEELEKLVLDDNKIIDYGLLSEDIAFIKYTK